jgi:hypothetical protein
MKILCYVNHFFGQNPFFEGKSSITANTTLAEIERRAAKRKTYVEEVIKQLRSIAGTDVKVCGIRDYSLVPIDIEFNHIKEKPLLLIYESLDHMAQFVSEYDYFINIEDDVLLLEETFRNIVAFDKVSLINEILLPNRLEKAPDGEHYCVDLKAIPGWTQQWKYFNGIKVQVAMNPHSAILVLSREKLNYAKNFINRNFREAFLYNELDSAFAYYHSPFSLFRSQDIGFHYIVHLDNWIYSEGERNYQSVWHHRLRSLRATEFVPPIIVRLIRYLKRLIT